MDSGQDSIVDAVNTIIWSPPALLTAPKLSSVLYNFSKIPLSLLDEGSWQMLHKGSDCPLLHRSLLNSSSSMDPAVHIKLPSTHFDPLATKRIIAHIQSIHHRCVVELVRVEMGR